MGFIIRPVKADTDMSAAKVAPAGITPLAASRSKVGKVTLSSGSDSDRILYYTLKPGQKAPRKIKPMLYAGEPIDMRDGGTVVAWKEDAPKARVDIVYEPISIIPLEISYVSSQELSNGEAAANLLDDDPSTIWHSVYGVTVANYPHRIEFDASDVQEMKGFTWQHRQSGANGNIKDFSIEVSNDGKTWTPVMTGAFTTSKQPQTFTFPAPVKARFVRLNAISSQNGADFASGAEFRLIK